jgi:hypothetical protein
LGNLLANACVGTSDNDNLVAYLVDVETKLILGSLYLAIQIWNILLCVLGLPRKSLLHKTNDGSHFDSLSVTALM